jgi:C4-dicarboxylate-specific signal transduction histidine kinase
MHMDRLRVAVTTVVVSAAAVAGAVAWTWLAHRQAASTSASMALAAVDMRLNDMAHELRRIAALPALQNRLTECPAALVQALLDESLHSSLLRRFEVVERDNPVRCGPQGARMAEPPVVSEHPGLSIFLGTQIAARPELMFTLGNGLAVRAKLDASALQLQHDMWPDDLSTSALVINARSLGGGTLNLWGASRGLPADQPAWLQAQVQSAQHHVTLTATVSRSTFLNEAGRAAAWAALQAGLLTLFGVAWVWRRSVLRSRLVHRLSYALRKRQFEPFVQPILDLQSGRCVGGAYFGGA